MRFHYSMSLWGVDEDGSSLYLTRPEIPITIRGPLGSTTAIALVDTGSDNSIFPKSFADKLGISLEEMAGPPVDVFGGGSLKLLYGEVSLTIESDGEVLSWLTSVCFFDFPKGGAESSVLGHAGFLNYFAATFDGQDATLTLVPNGDLPVGN